MGANVSKMKRKVIIWGHPLHSHTHSYIHYAFHKAFSFLGYETIWTDDPTIDFPAGSLVITEGQVDRQMPIIKGCRYLLHNCDIERYENVGIDFKVLQVYSHDCLDRDVEKLAPFEYYQPAAKTLYQPWGTDLLPPEIDDMSLIDAKSMLDYTCNWVGSVMPGEHGNIDQVQGFAIAASENNVELRVHRNVDHSTGIKLVRSSYLAPAINGAWQVKNGYIPCRIFKNVSYGHLGMTNSLAVHDLFEGMTTYNSDCRQLFYDGVRDFAKKTVAERLAVQQFVRDNHTYVNRIQNILRVMEID